MAALALLGGAQVALAQAPSRADSQLVARVLLAEDQRDSASMAYHEAASSADARIRELGRRALARVRDPKFTERTTFADPIAWPVYNDPAWRLRFRGLTGKRTDCAALRSALSDDMWAVRLRAVDLVPASCAVDTALVRTLKSWAAATPARAQRKAGNVSWHAGAHALVALATVAPADARIFLADQAASGIPWVRAWSARAAAALADTSTLRRLARDPDDNVKEAAVDGLAKLAGHSADDDYIAALSSRGYQAVRAGARALEKSPRGADVLKASLAAAKRLRRDSSETSRDARVAVLARIGEFAGPGDMADVSALAADFDCQVAQGAATIAAKIGARGDGALPHCTPLPVTLPADAVGLALGHDVRVRVTMADSSGGGAFIVRMRGDVAPIMAARILALVRGGYYNGLTWQRVEPDFVVQGGGPGSSEYVGHPRFMRDELGRVSHARGTIGMSTRGHDTGDGQWFFNLKDNAILDPTYTVFADVVEGMNVVDAILEGDVIARMEIVKA